MPFTFVKSRTAGTLVDVNHSPQNVMSAKTYQYERCTVTSWEEGLTKNNGHVNEIVAQRVAVVRHKFRGRCTPPRWIGRAGENVLWNRGAVE